MGGTIVCGIVAWLLWRFWRRSRLRLYCTGYYMEMDDPIAVCGIPDVIWRRGDGVLVVADYKSRAGRQVYESERIQLSVYRLLLQRTQKRPVAGYGYVEFGGGRSKKIRLLSERELIKLYRRYLEVRGGRCRTLREAEHKSYCHYCSCQQYCE